MIFPNEMTELQLYKRPFHLPINETNKKKGSSIFLLTPNYQSTKKLLSNPLMITNDNYFRSYFIEKDITYYINQEGTLIDGSLDIINESFEEDLLCLNESERIRIKNTDSYVEEGYMRCSIGNNDVMFIFNEGLDEDTESDSTKNNKVLRKILYNERLKTNKDVFSIYNNIKKDFPWLTKTFINLKMYNELNVFVDLFYYNQAFFKNNIYKANKGVQLYFDFINRFINDKRITNAGYNTKTVFVPVVDWYNTELDFTKSNKDINPISLIFNLLKKDPTKLKMWKGMNFLFFGDKGYFKVDLSNLDSSNISKFRALINKLILNSDIIEEEPPVESKKSIVASIVNKIEKSQGMEINDISNKDDKIISKGLTGKDQEISKDELVNKIEKAAATSKTVDDAIDQLDKEDNIKNIIKNLAEEEDNNVKINAARAARINKLQQNFLDKNIEGTSVRQMIEDSHTDDKLPSTSINVDSINDDWKDMSYINFERTYNPDDDIVSMLNSLVNLRNPIAVRDIKVEDTSTSEDYVKTYSVQMEDAVGGRFTIRFDIPELVDGKFLMLRGNQKTINGQLTQIPIMKTEEEVLQIVSNYNKIFIRRFGTTRGKSFPMADRLIKAISKYPDVAKAVIGDNSKVCGKYELPMDYVDIATGYSSIENKVCKFFFNQDDFRKKYKDKIELTKGLPIGIYKHTNEIIYFKGNPEDTCSGTIVSILLADPKFATAFDSTNVATRYTYSQASILSSKMPLILVMAYCEGLTSILKKANIKYELSEKRLYNKNNYEYDSIRFKDGYLSYQLRYDSALLMNGLKDCNTEDYSLSQLNDRTMFLDFLDLFGGRIKADGIDNFYDLMIDPITLDILHKYKLPTNFIDLLIYANILLCDNKYIAHTDMRGRRYRSNELIAGYFYKALSASYGAYANQLRKRGKATMTMKQSAVIDGILLDPTASDLSILNDLLLIEAINALSYKGLAGMNTDRSYSLDKRTFDKSMLNLLGLSTGFAGNVGITRQATLDMNVKDKRGLLKITDDTSKLSLTKTFTATEALTPFGVTHDDPFRSAMTFIQTSKHGMRIKKGMPSLVSNGADQALPYLTPNIFSYKAKDDGKVVEKTDDYMIVKYKDGKSELIDLRNKIRKNSNGGFYASVKLDTDLKVGSNIKKQQILAYDKLSYSDVVGGDCDNIAYNLGALAKIAILNTDEGFEDSAIISDYLSDIMSSEVVIKKDVTFPKNTNILSMVKKGQQIQEGDPLVIFQNAFEEDDINVLLKNLSKDEKVISDLGRIPIKSHVTGVVEDIKIYRTVDKEDMSESLKKIVTDYEKPITKLKKVMDGHHIKGSNRLEADYKLNPTGKVKHLDEGVLVEFYLKYDDKMSIGDKLIYYSALKGVIKEIFPVGKEPKSELRPDEVVHTLLSVGSVSGRMVCSLLINVAINKVLVELDRNVKDILGIPWTYLDDTKPKK